MLDVIYEDDSLLVLSKPSGQIVNRSDTTASAVTLQEELEKYFGIGRLGSAEPSNSGLGIGGRAGIVHRLDKETSGVLVVAKTPEAFDKLQAQFKERTVDKEYLALVHGETPREGEIAVPIGRLPGVHGRFGVVEGGRESITSYLREAVLSAGEEDYFRAQRGKKVPERSEGLYSFVRVRPLTGRTHQVRVHFKHIGHPVAADPLYLSSKRLKQDLKFCPRLFLHAASLTFTHPTTGARMRFEAELPDDLRLALSHLRPLT